MSTVKETSNSNALMQSLTGASTTSKSETEAAGDRFLTLLVTQMKNQDPLNPLDNAQVTSQLAQINTVTGLDKLNTTLQSLTSGFASTQMLQAATMIGREVLVPSDHVNLSQGAARFGVELTQPADEVVVSILDAAGNAVRTQKLGAQSAGTGTFAWNGLNDLGAAMPDGRYTLSVSAKQGGKAIGVDTLSYARVESVAQSGQTQRCAPYQLTDSNWKSGSNIDFHEAA
jgi:flagellar basal-body rod modification protein FlgD